MIQSLLQYTLPILLASFGGLVSDLAGTLNIALESLILLGAFVTYVVSIHAQSPLAGIMAGSLASGAVVLVFYTLALKGRANIFVTGLGLNLLIPGAVATASSLMYGTRGVLRFDNFPLQPTVLSVPLPLLFSYAMLACIWYLISASSAGLRIRAMGLHPHVAQIRGVSPFRTRIAALVISGLACGAAGGLLVLSLRAYVPNVSAGRGWIALAAIYLGKRRPWGVLAATVLFGAAELAANIAQGMFALPSPLFMALPYVAAVTALIIQGLISHRKKPS